MLKITPFEGLELKKHHSPSIVNNIENLLKAVNMGRFNDLVEPSPQITFPRNINEIGSISLQILQFR
jgi:hypothetical protein